MPCPSLNLLMNQSNQVNNFAPFFPCKNVSSPQKISGLEILQSYAICVVEPSIELFVFAKNNAKPKYLHHAMSC